MKTMLFHTFVADTPVTVEYWLDERGRVDVRHVFVADDGRPIKFGWMDYRGLYEALRELIKREIKP